MSSRAEQLAIRLEEGADALGAFAAALTEAEWLQPLPGDGRPIGVVVHHVANVYPIEVELAAQMSKGQPVEGVTWAGIAAMNAAHAQEHGRPDRAGTLALLKKASRVAAAAVRGMSDHALDTAVPVSLYGAAPLTAQFFIEDHALRHSWHHLARIREAVGRATVGQATADVG
jgi:hypothetical protein